MPPAEIDRGSDRAELLSNLFDRLFPICRSITGPGIRDSLAILQEQIPLRLEGIASGSKVFDWTIPPEWHLRAARLTGPDGRVFADLERTNLCVVNFSRPVDQHLSLEALRPHLHSLPSLPDAIPYVTSYYQENWGFCLPDRVLENLPEGTYHAFIDAELTDGELNFAHVTLPGEGPGEVVLSSYLCHPSLANNELSGPLAMVELYHRISRWPRRRFSYRFVIGPETIGSLAFLSLFGEHLAEHMVAGLVLTCLGGPQRSLSYKTTRGETALIDRLVGHMKQHEKLAVDVRPFTPCGGSDERQYCSPGFNLPMGQMARTVYGEYDGYHNSLDDKEFMGISPLLESAAAIEKLLWALEYAGPFTNLSPYGEPQLGRRNLYPNVNRQGGTRPSTDELADGRVMLNRILTLLSYSDGNHSLIWIADRLGCSLFELTPLVDRLCEEGLLAPTAQVAG